MNYKISKPALLALLVSIVTGSQALAAGEALVLTGVYSKFPTVVELRDKQQVYEFLDTNFEALPAETVITLQDLLKTPTAGVEFPRSIDKVLINTPMCMVD